MLFFIICAFCTVKFNSYSQFTMVKKISSLMNTVKFKFGLICPKIKPICNNHKCAVMISAVFVYYSSCVYYVFKSRFPYL